jgi:hypothetical protein
MANGKGHTYQEVIRGKPVDMLGNHKGTRRKARPVDLVYARHKAGTKTHHGSGVPGSAHKIGMAFARPDDRDKWLYPSLQFPAPLASIGEAFIVVDLHQCLAADQQD